MTIINFLFLVSYNSKNKWHAVGSPMVVEEKDKILTQKLIYYFLLKYSKSKILIQFIIQTGMKVFAWTGLKHIWF